MNCKPGDLAIIVQSAAGNEGKIVRCVSLAGEGRHVLLNVSGPIWVVDPPVRSVRACDTGLVMDCFMRPIRDPGDDAKDELLRPLPQEVTA